MLTVHCMSKFCGLVGRPLLKGLTPLPQINCEDGGKLMVWSTRSIGEMQTVLRIFVDMI